MVWLTNEQANQWTPRMYEGVADQRTGRPTNPYADTATNEGSTDEPLEV